MPTACTSKRCGYHIVMTMVRSQLGGTNPHAPTLDIEYTCALTRIVFLPPRCSQVAKTGGNHGGPAKNPPMQMNTLTKTHIKSRADQNGKSTNIRNTNRCLAKPVPNRRCGDHIVAPQHNEPTWKHTSSGSRSGNPQVSWATTLVVSLPQPCTRIARKCWQSWRLDPPLLCGMRSQIQQ